MCKTDVNGCGAERVEAHNAIRQNQAGHCQVRRVGVVCHADALTQHWSAASAVRHVGVAYQALRRMRSQRFSWRANVVMHLSLVYRAERPTRCTLHGLADGCWRGKCANGC